MRLELTGQHIDINPTLRRLVESKLDKLERVLNHRALSAQAVLKREKNRCRAEITVHARGERFLHGTGAANAWEPAVTASIEKIAQQAQKVKGKWEARKRRGRRAGLAIDQPEAVAVASQPAAGGRVRARMPRIFRAERQAIKAMTVAEAARQLDGADGVLVFRDTESDAISVLDRRNGELTLVETES
jgi:putative sigma-54 modulation protein